MKSKNRSRRLRKKLHLGEFRELGFQLTVYPTKTAAHEDDFAVMDAFLEQIEAHQLCFAGSFQKGFVRGIVAGLPGAAITLDLIQTLTGWWAAQPTVRAVWHSPVYDVWHTDPDSIPF